MYENKGTNTELRNQWVKPNKIMPASILIDLSDAVDAFRTACCDTQLADNWDNPVNDEIKWVMPFISKAPAEIDKLIERYQPLQDLYMETKKAFAVLGEETADLIAKAHYELAVAISDIFKELECHDEDGNLPYLFERRVTSDAYLFITPVSATWDPLLKWQFKVPTIQTRGRIQYSIGNLIIPKAGDEVANEQLIGE
jgi:hypothetical protein